MPDWAVSLLEAVGRLVTSVAGCGKPGPETQDCATELADDINNLAYQLEHDKD